MNRVSEKCGALLAIPTHTKQEYEEKDNEKGAVRNNTGQKAVMYPSGFIHPEIREKGISLT